jgi:hypothetical protein
MRKTLFLTAFLALSVSAHAAFIGFAGGAFLHAVEVPNVVGLSTAAADTTLEGAGLDTGSVNTQCSSKVLNEVLSQDPISGTFVLIGSTVDLIASTGVACTWDLTGLPLSWEPLVDVQKHSAFIVIRLQECDGNGDWAKWRAGTSIVPRGTSNCVLQRDIIRVEADTDAVWARWAPGTTSKNSANLQLDVRTALNANFDQ